MRNAMTQPIALLAVLLLPGIALAQPAAPEPDEPLKTKPAAAAPAVAPPAAAETAKPPEPKSEPKPEAKVEPKAEPKPEPKPEPKAAEAKPAAKPVAAPPAKGEKIAVMDFTLGGQAHPDLARVLGDGAARGAAGPGVQVMSQGEIVALLGLDRTKQMLGCDDPGCITELGHALDSDKLVSGSLTILGRTSLLTVRLIDAKKSRTLARTTATLADATEAELVETARRLAHEALTGEKVDTSGTVRVAVNVAGASVTLDGKSLGETPLKGSQRVLEGPHSVVIQKPGFIRWATTVTVAAGAEAKVDAELLPIQLISEKARSRLWSWGFAAAGVAVLSGGAGITFGTMASNSYDDYKLARTRTAAADARDKTKFRATLANVSWGIAGAATAGAGYLLFSAVREDARAAGDAAKAAETGKSAGIQPIPGGAAVVFTGAF
jgi:hypothetical protein